jgi:hypothetical protein
MVGNAIIIQQINSYLLNKHYDGFNEEWKNRKAVANLMAKQSSLEQDGSIH